MDPREKQIDKLEEELGDPDLTPSERQDIIQSVFRDIERDVSEKNRWLEEGYDRGWL